MTTQTAFRGTYHRSSVSEGTARYPASLPPQEQLAPFWISSSSLWRLLEDVCRLVVSFWRGLDALLPTACATVSPTLVPLCVVPPRKGRLLRKFRVNCGGALVAEALGSGITSAKASKESSPNVLHDCSPVRRQCGLPVLLGVFRLVPRNILTRGEQRWGRWSRSDGSSNAWRLRADQRWGRRSGRRGKLSTFPRLDQRRCRWSRFGGHAIAFS